MANASKYQMAMISASVSLKTLPNHVISVKIGHDWQVAWWRRGQQDRQLKMASPQWFQARGYSQSLYYLQICLQPVPCLAATGLSWGPARHLHALLWPSSGWVITPSFWQLHKHWWSDRERGVSIFRNDFSPKCWRFKKSMKAYELVTFKKSSKKLV